MKDQFITAISEKKLGQLSEFTKMYVKIAETFLDYLNIYGVSYSYEQARKEHGVLFGSWKEMKWLQHDIYEIFEKGIQSNDKDIVSDIAYLPISIAIRAIKYGDQYLYQQFLRFPMLLYIHASEKSDLDENVREFMIDRSWRYLRDMSNYYIQPELKRSSGSVEDINKYGDFTIPVFLHFQELAKEAFTKRDFETFTIYLNNIASLFKHFAPYGGVEDSTYLEMSLKRVQTQEEKNEILKKIKSQKASEKIAKDIGDYKSLIIIGLSAWIFDLYRSEKANDVLKDHFNEIFNRLPKNIEDLTEDYIKARDFETEDLM